MIKIHFSSISSMKLAFIAELPNNRLPRPDRLHHIVEDFLTQWTGSSVHLLPLRRFLEFCTDTDLRNFTDQQCLVYSLTQQALPQSCKKYLNNRETIGTQIQVDTSIKIKSSGLKS